MLPTLALQQQPYLSMWCALQDITAQNGCLVVIPGSHLGVTSAEALRLEKKQVPFLKLSLLLFHVLISVSSLDVSCDLM